MKKLTVLLALLFTLTMYSQEQTYIKVRDSISVVNNDENTFLSFFIDPTFKDRGAQYGVTITKEVLYGYIEASASVYPQLEPSYFDLVFSGGLALEKGIATFHTGPRAGMELRGGGPFVLFGYQGRLLFRITPNIYLGGKVWLDYRYSQDDQFYGTGDMIRENAAFVLSIRLN